MGSILSERSKYAENAIAVINRAAAKLSAKGIKVTTLDRGDPAVYFKTPKYVIDAYIRALRENRTGYSRPEGARELVDAVIKRYRRMYKLRLAEEDVTITSGLSEAFFFLNSAVINRGDSAIIFRPYYPPYHTYLKLNEGSEIMGRYDEQRNWEIDVDNLRAILKSKKKLVSRGHVKYMLLTNPNNPTGTVLARSALKEIVDVANENGIFLVSDEIYDEVVFNGAKFTSLGEVASGVPHMIWSGASKNLDATGFRVGFAVIPEEDKSSIALKRTFSNYALARLSVNTPAQYAIAEALNNVAEHNRATRSMVKEIESRVNYATKRINESKYMHVARPSGTFYIFPKVDLKALGFKSDNDLVLSILEATGIQIRSGTAFGEPSHIRMVSLAPKEILGYAIDRINDFCKKKAAR